nr:YeeE/YedE family protein [Bauldia sp.]
LVGIGTRIGHGCTSGHGICGLSRLSPRSFVAVGTFMATAMATVFLVRHVLP